MHCHDLRAGTPFLSALPHGHLPLWFFRKSNLIVTLSLKTPHWLPTAWIRHPLRAVPGPPLQDFLITSRPLNNKVKTHSIIYRSLNGPGCCTSLCLFVLLSFFRLSSSLSTQKRLLTFWEKSWRFFCEFFSDSDLHRIYHSFLQSTCALFRLLL